MALFKNFTLPKNGGHFEFLPKMEKHKFSSVSLTVRDRAILLKFSTHMVSKKSTIGNFFKKFSCPQKFGHFEFFRRNFRPTGYCKQCTLGNFQKILLSPKVVAILNFQIFAQNEKNTQIFFYLL